MDFIWILWSHYIADFILQRRVDAENKWHSIKHLGIHIFTYWIAMTFMLYIWFGAIAMPLVLINVLLHLIIDFITSKISHSFYERGEIKAFWDTIGFDQLLHVMILYITWDIVNKIYLGV